MAKMEKDKGIASTYYFRHMPGVFDPDMMKEISSLGHEVGYHYETLSKTQGDAEKAWTLFLRELEEMREHVSVRTVCMHGRPASPFNNLDLWKGREPKSTEGITGEAYLSVDFDKWLYFSDTGRRWDRRYSMRDNTSRSPLNIKRTEGVIAHVKKNRPLNIYILAHPNRWATSFGDWAVELILQNIKNPGKYVLRKVRGGKGR
ncbi:MAG: hypothetical protein KAT70_06735, partial [Thermoplasmata archaeon]|nr:hypothetical protein [Thermoplasmata archaeon]